MDAVFVWCPSDSSFTGGIKLDLQHLLDLLWRRHQCVLAVQGISLGCLTLFQFQAVRRSCCFPPLAQPSDEQLKMDANGSISLQGHLQPRGFFPLCIFPSRFFESS